MKQTLKAWPQVHPPRSHLACFKMLKVRTAGTPCQGITTTFILPWHRSIRERRRKLWRGVGKKKIKKNLKSVDYVKLVQVSRKWGLSKQFDRNKIKGSAFACELVMRWKNINALETHFWNCCRKAKTKRCSCTVKYKTVYTLSCITLNVECSLCYLGIITLIRQLNKLQIIVIQFSSPEKKKNIKKKDQGSN